MSESKSKPAGRTHAIICVATVILAALVHAVASGVIGSRDVLEGLLVKREFVPLVMLLVLFAARLFLFFLAPGWISFVVLRIALERGRLRPP